MLISIHALLAESDTKIKPPLINKSISIHALLAESDVPSGLMSKPVESISIHALLAESDFLMGQNV